VRKTEDGVIESILRSDLEADEALAFGAAVGALIGFGAAGDDGMALGAVWGTEPEAEWGVLGAGDEVRPVPTVPGDYTAFYDGVARALLEGGPPPVDPADAVRVLELLEAARLA